MAGVRWLRVSRVDPLVVPRSLATRAGRLPRLSLFVSARFRASDALFCPNFASHLRALAGRAAALSTSLGLCLRVGDCLGRRLLSSLPAFDFSVRQVSGLGLQGLLMF